MNTSLAALDQMTKYDLQDLRDAETNIAEQKAIQNDLESQIDDINKHLENNHESWCPHCWGLRNDLRRYARELAESYTITAECQAAIDRIHAQYAKPTLSVAQTAVISVAMAVLGAIIGVYFVAGVMR